MLYSVLPCVNTLWRVHILSQLMQYYTHAKCSYLPTSSLITTGTATSSSPAQQGLLGVLRMTFFSCIHLILDEFFSAWTKISPSPATFVLQKYSVGEIGKNFSWQKFPLYGIITVSESCLYKCYIILVSF